MHILTKSWLIAYQGIKLFDILVSKSITIIALGQLFKYRVEQFLIHNLILEIF